MKKLIRTAALILLASASVSVAPVMANEVSSYELEKALMKYVLTYEAYQKAKQSPNKEVRANLPKYIRLYREAYAQYLELLRESELYDPSDENKENDPAGNFNKGRPSKQQVRWGAVKSGSQREQVKKVVENGGNPDEVCVVVKQNLPKKKIAKTEQEIEDEQKEAEQASSGGSGETASDTGVDTGTNTSSTSTVNTVNSGSTTSGGGNGPGVNSVCNL
ncbi:MAG: hypothetical protein IKO19_10875 [Candidatus Riflebacteria bacterium]|nr:hypothetical protein [Candidatus Riflebacteria bacterium]MBR4571149.1 hypothetical protein [Candidatus Riflebacteria bacterium]